MAKIMKNRLKMRKGAVWKFKNALKIFKIPAKFNLEKKTEEYLPLLSC